MRKLSTVVIAAASLCPTYSQTSPEKKTGAREMYFAAWEEVRPRPKPARQVSPKVKAPAKISTPPGAQPRAVPLGLRYTLLRRVGGEPIEISPSAVFRSGDRIQIAIEANDNAYLYIVHQGSSGGWQVMFPSAEIADGNNRLEKGKKYMMPPGGVFALKDPPGTEKLFLVLSRQPEPDLDRLIYSLPTGKTRPSEPSGPPMLLAMARPIDNAVVDNIRRTYTRDFVIEKIEDEPAAGRGENAMYIVNPTGRPDARVVTDIVLIHR